jgi:hypothetical protein
MFSNKFEVGIFYVFKVGIIRINFKFLKSMIPIFVNFLLFKFSLEFALFFPFFPQQELPSLKTLK